MPLDVKDDVPDIKNIFQLHAGLTSYERHAERQERLCESIDDIVKAMAVEVSLIAICLKCLNDESREGHYAATEARSECDVERRVPVTQALRSVSSMSFLVLVRGLTTFLKRPDWQ